MNDFKTYIRNCAFEAVKEFSKHNPDFGDSFLQGLFDGLLGKYIDENNYLETICKGLYLLFCNKINQAINDNNVDAQNIPSPFRYANSAKKEGPDDEENEEEDSKDDKRHYRVEICTGDMERELVMDVELDNDKTVIPDYSSKIH